MTRTPLQQFARAVLIGLPIAASPLVSAGASLGVLSLALLIAYDGVVRHAVWRVLAFLFAVEIVTGMVLGVLMLPYLVACLSWYIAQRVVPLAPWSSTDGWRLSDAVRTAASAGVLWGMMLAAAVAVQALVYGRGATFQRLALAFNDVPLITVAILGILMLTLLRRVDAPFRTKLRFGT